MNNQLVTKVASCTNRKPPLPALPQVSWRVSMIGL